MSSDVLCCALTTGVRWAVLHGQCDVLGQISCSSSGVSEPGPTTLDASLWKDPTWWFEGPTYCECQWGCPDKGIDWLPAQNAGAAVQAAERLVVLGPLGRTKSAMFCRYQGSLPRLHEGICQADAALFDGPRLGMTWHSL